MKWSHAVKGSVAAILVVFLTGCAMVSPVLLQLPTEDAGSGKVPLKVGLAQVQKAGGQDLTHISTYAMLGIYQFYGRMPRRSEADYMSRAMGDYLRDKKTFSYIYNEPFDRNDVNLVLKARLADFDMKNNTGFSTLLQHVGMIPVVGIVGAVWMLAGLPMEFFATSQDLEFVLETPAGKEVATYRFKTGASDGVNMYEQPFGNYMWYDSVFQQEFFKLMGQFEAAVSQDRAKLMAAAGK